MRRACGAWVLSALAAWCLCQRPAGLAKRHDVYIAGFFPFARHVAESRLGRGVMPAVKLAVDHINDCPTVLRNYRLHMWWNDTEPLDVRKHPIDKLHKETGLESNIGRKKNENFRPPLHYKSERSARRQMARSGIKGSEVKRVSIKGRSTLLRHRGTFISDFEIAPSFEPPRNRSFSRPATRLDRELSSIKRIGSA
ncbi:unnamed protein product [Bemisia tabaci]|uniref:Uncharacterized protein n=1 Tax=Bemisia tabaci TaxID=7038 RepID=A0A9P0A2T7_BEMTA|nr:unnamed protein product [Bemisia tabaci]